MTEHEKREKVIKGLEFCLMPTTEEELMSDVCSHDDCPYYREYRGGQCVSAVARDALAMLEAQEPIETRLNLCESCTKEYADCEADNTDLVYGSGVGNDNIIGCPWYVNRWKAQEPRVMSLEEVQALHANDVVWLEDKGKPNIIPGIVRNRHLWPHSVAMVTNFMRGDGYKVTAGDDDYGERWRCWTSRPTDEQREAEVWSD